MSNSNYLRAKFQDLVGMDVINHGERPGTDAHTELSIVCAVHPVALIQCFAFDGMGFLPDGTHLHCTDWNEIPKDIKMHLKGALMVNAQRIVRDELGPNGEGLFELHACSTIATVQ